MHASPLFRRAALLTISLIAATALITTACGGDDDDDSGSPTSSTGGNTPAASASPTRSAATSPTAAATSATTPNASGDQDAIVKVGETSIGEVLTNADGLTLYTFDNDTAGSDASVCNAGCVSAWPPLTTTESTAPTVEGATGEFALITREDGAMQVTYEGKPLYTYVNDTAAGETKGDGVGGIWHAANP